MQKHKSRSGRLLWLIFVVLLAGCASGPLTKREKGALMGSAGGAVIGEAPGVLGGGLLGDQFERREQEQWEQQRELDRQKESWTGSSFMITTKDTNTYHTAARF